MARGDLITYITKGVSQGHTVASLREHLVSHGFTATDVDAAIAIYHSPSVSSGKPRKIILFVSFSVALFMIVLFSLLLSEETCDGTSCLAESFMTCTPFQTHMEVLEGLVLDIAILGSVDTGCSVRIAFVENPNPAWIGPSMICVYDTVLPIEEAMQDLTRCDGELAHLYVLGK